MGLTPEDLHGFLAAFEAGTWQEMTLSAGADRLHVSRRRERVVDRVNTGIASEAPPVPVIAPSIGLFRRTASPGEHVRAADSVGTVDVAGMLRPIPAGVDGTIDAVLADDGAMVEYGEPVVLVRPRTDRGEGDRSGPR
jgi:acetyl-CoA carboxylase biotin carboxyl carrier protein